MHVRKGDTVVVITGKDKGKRGRVLRILSAKGRWWSSESPWSNVTPSLPSAIHVAVSWKGRHTGSFECGAVVREVQRRSALPSRHQRGTEETARVREVRVGN